MSAAQTIATQAESFFGWLDYDAAESERMREVLAAFDEKGTVDSLGLAVMRDAISDQLFPGISTIQTRARYFLFVPWICQILESKSLPRVDFNRDLRALEVALIESLRARCEADEGVIGYEAREKLQRMPSSVYWNGIRTFGIRRLSASIPQYRSILIGGSTKSRAVLSDHDGASRTDARGMWDHGMPQPPDGFPRTALRLRLTREESEYLAAKIATQVPGSMVAELARDLTINRTADHPWDVPLVNPPSQLTDSLEHGRAFAELMQGAQALYNLLLAQRAERELGWNTARNQSESEKELEGWNRLINSRRRELRAWNDGGSFWDSNLATSRAPLRTQRFVHDWINLALAKHDSIKSNTDAARLITNRELQLKGNLARLTSNRALEAWTGTRFGSGQFDFRWQNAKTILSDLEHHEGAPVAKS